MMSRSPERNFGAGVPHLGDPRPASKRPRKQPRCFTDMIDQIIIDKGLSVRKAKKIRKAIFSLWTLALRRGEIVETPLGEMQAVRAPKRRARINRVNPKPQSSPSTNESGALCSGRGLG
jgi:hypothetical protein